MERIGDNELASIMAHELEHIINDDLFFKKVLSLSTVLFAVWSSSLSSSLVVEFLYNQDININYCLLVGAVSLAAAITSFYLGLLVCCFFARQDEFMTDEGAARHIGSSQYLCETLSGSIGSYENDNLLVSHPSSQSRVEALRSLDL